MKRAWAGMTAGDGKRLLARWLEDGLLISMLPEVENLKGVPQPAEYHAEGDVFTHTMLAVSAVPDQADLRVFWAALLHDIGKSLTTEMAEGRLRALGHADAGAGMVPAVMERVGMVELAEDVAWLVKNHMFHFSWQLSAGSRLTGRQASFMEHPLFPLLLQVCAADAAASLGKSDKSRKLKLFESLFDKAVSARIKPPSKQ